MAARVRRGPNATGALFPRNGPVLAVDRAASTL